MSPQDETIGTLIDWGTGELREAGIEFPGREARLLLAHLLRLDTGSMLLRDRSRPLQTLEITGFRSSVGRRSNREPLAYITGKQGFWTLDFMVSDVTLIPRADSETLIESLLASRPDRSAVERMLDLGTGTGCLLLAALSEYPNAWGVGIDVSPRACDLALANAIASGLDARCAFLCGRWTDALAAEVRGFDVILSNPPYIPADDIAALMPEVRHFEPASALDGGKDGLAAYRIIVSRLPALLAAGGVAILELGTGQLDAVESIAKAAGLAVASVRTDLGGTARAIALENP